MADLQAGNPIPGINGTGTVRAIASSQKALLKLRRTGDRCRDRRDWPRARDCYARYLESAPADAAIWIQYGHSCQELGDLNAAEAAYRKSIEIAPSGDACLSLGRVLKAKGDVAASAAALRKAVELEAGFALDIQPRDGATDLRDIFAPAPRRMAGTLPKRVLIDLSDVLVYLRDYNTVSGIQRVQLSLADALLRLLPQLPYKLAFICAVDDELGWREIDNPHLVNLIRRMSSPKVNQERLREAIYQIEADAAPYEPANGDLFLMLGAFWGAVFMEKIHELKKEGVSIGILIHDIFPITHPEFCDKSVIESFELCCDKVMRVVDLLLAVSDYSGQAVQQYLRKAGIPRQPVLTLRPAHQTGVELQSPKDGRSCSPIVASLLKRPFVLYVSTIQARKNHRYLLQVWKQLYQELGEDTPNLILVGQIGWFSGDLVEEMKNTNFLNGKVKMLSGITDPELSSFYQNSLFTVYPSFAEGWGLPIGESLAFGRPCLASSTSSMPEVAGDFVDYLDPFNVHDGYRKIRNFIIDAGLRESRADNIRENFKPRLWSDMANDLLRIVEEYAAQPHGSYLPPDPPLLHPGIIYRVGHRGNISGFVGSGHAFLVQTMCDENWHGIEDWGRWMRGRFASLAIRLAEEEPREIMLVVEFRAAPEFKSAVRITVNDAAPVSLNPEADSTGRIVVKAILDRRSIRIGFESADQVAMGDDSRPLSVGICAIAYAALDDLSARLSLLEELNAQVYDLRADTGSL